MWISQGTWLNQLRWNRFRMTYGDDYKLYVHFTVELTTNRLGIFRLNDDRLDRLKLIKHLLDSGMSNKEITEYLNRHNIKTPKGLAYYPKLVWVTLSKYKRRLQRNNADETLKHIESLVVVYRKKRIPQN